MSTSTPAPVAFVVPTTHAEVCVGMYRMINLELPVMDPTIPRRAAWGLTHRTPLAQVVQCSDPLVPDHNHITPRVLDGINSGLYVRTGLTHFSGISPGIAPGTHLQWASHEASRMGFPVIGESPSALSYLLSGRPPDNVRVYAHGFGSASQRYTPQMISAAARHAPPMFVAAITSDMHTTGGSNASVRVTDFDYTIARSVDEMDSRHRKPARASAPTVEANMTNGSDHASGCRCGIQAAERDGTLVVHPLGTHPSLECPDGEFLEGVALEFSAVRMRIMAVDLTSCLACARLWDGGLLSCVASSSDLNFCVLAALRASITSDIGWRFLVILRCALYMTRGFARIRAMIAAFFILESDDILDVELASSDSTRMEYRAEHLQRLDHIPVQASYVSLTSVLASTVEEITARDTMHRVTIASGSSGSLPSVMHVHMSDVTIALQEFVAASGDYEITASHVGSGYMLIGNPLFVVASIYLRHLSKSDMQRLYASITSCTRYSAFVQQSAAELLRMLWMARNLQPIDEQMRDEEFQDPDIVKEYIGATMCDNEFMRYQRTPVDLLLYGFRLPVRNARTANRVTQYGLPLEMKTLMTRPLVPDITVERSDGQWYPTLLRYAFMIPTAIAARIMVYEMHSASRITMGAMLADRSVDSYTADMMSCEDLLTMRVARNNVTSDVLDSIDDALLPHHGLPPSSEFFGNASMNRPIVVNFEGENAVDDGGPIRELFEVITREMLAPHPSDSVSDALEQSHSDCIPPQDVRPHACSRNAMRRHAIRRDVAVHVMLNTDGEVSHAQLRTAMAAVPLAVFDSSLPKRKYRSPFVVLDDSNYWWFGPLADEAVGEGCASIHDIKHVKSWSNSVAILLMMMAARSHVTLSLRLPEVFYRMLQGGLPRGADAELLFPSMCASFVKLVHSSEEELEAMDLAFVITTPLVSGRIVDIPLVYGGADIRVTCRNVVDYVWRYIEAKLIHLTRNHVEDMVHAFDYFSRYKSPLVSLSAAALKGVVSGVSPSDLSKFDTMITYTSAETIRWSSSWVRASGATVPDIPVLRYFWTVWDELEVRERESLIHFISGSRRLPCEAVFDEIMFTIELSVDTNLLPTAHTCMRKFVLPVYDTLETTRTRLRIAIENEEGFGFR